MLISQTDSAGTLYFLPDAQGSTRALTDEGGLLGQTFDYDAFGNLQDEYLNGLDTNYLYTGQQFDPISELYLLRARYYDPSLGRLLSRDTWPYDYQNPVELNRYVYAVNNPATWSDPSGNVGITGHTLTFKANEPSRKAFIAFSFTFANLVVWSAIVVLIGALVYQSVAANPPIPRNWDDPFDDIRRGLRNAWDGLKDLLKDIPIPIPLDPPNDPPDDDRQQRHISLGLQDNGYLTRFTANLNVLLNPSNISVHAFTEITDFTRFDDKGMPIRIEAWHEVGLTSIAASAFNLGETFPEATRNADAIHFNLEGIRINSSTPNYVSFANLSLGQFGGGAPITATELFIIKNDPQLCGKTFFYKNGSQFPPIFSLSISQEICGFTPTIQLPARTG